MQRAIAVTFVVTLALAAGVRAVAAQTSPAPAQTVVGKWTSQADTPHGKMTIAMEFKADAKDAKKIGGTVAFGEMGEFPVTGEFVENKLTFSVGNFTFAGKLKDANTLTGVMSGEAGDIPIVATRVVAK
jgi:hypothetical protein